MKRAGKVKKKDTTYVTVAVGWEGALQDAEERLRKAEEEIAQWKRVIRVCRERIAQGAPWPGPATQN